MRIPVFFCLSLLLAQTAQAQWRQTGGYVQTKANTELAARGNLSLAAGTFRNRGRAVCQNLQTASAATLLGTGNCFVRQNLTLAGSLQERLTFQLTGDSASTVNAPGDPLYNLWLEKTSSAGATPVVNLAAPLAVDKQLKFPVGADNKLKINDFDLTMLAGSSIANADAGSFVVTNGAGRLVREGLGATNFKFPVGADTLRFNPFQITNSGAADDLGVRCLPDALTNGASGPPFASDAVAASWDVTEATPGGSNLVLKASWYLADELPGFARAHCALRRHDGTAWLSAPLGPATNAVPYTRTRTGVSDVGVFAVLDNSVPLAGADERAGNDLQLEISPNPASDVARLQVSGFDFSQNLDVQVFDSRGQLVRQERISGNQVEFTLRTGDLPPGEYAVEVRAGASRATARFVKI